MNPDTITLTDDDGVPSLSINSPSVTEGDSGSKNLTFTVTLSEASGWFVAEGDSGSRDLTFTVALSAASTEVVTVDYADAGTGTATPGTDYTAITGGTLTFPAGTTNGDIRVSVMGDTAAEPDETVVVSLGNPANATIGTGTGTGTITNDDDAGAGDDVDLMPSFGSATIPDQSWTQNRAITALTLPSATGGDGTLIHELGVALSHSLGELSYRGAGTGLDRARVDVDLNSVLPYGHWALNKRVALWALLGIGEGKASLTDGFGRATADTAMQMVALGGRGEFASWRGLGLALKGDAFAVGMAGSGSEELRKVDGSANRLRLMVEGRRDWRPSQQQRLGMRLEFGGRWDGGDADTGVGAELGGELEYRHAAWGLGVKTRGRYLLGHSERAFEEWGASLAAVFDPGEAGIGASLTLAPTWGEASSGVENLWRNERLLGAGLGGQGVPDERGTRRSNRLRMELGYGFKAGGPRLLKLYGALSEDGPGSRNWRLGGLMTGGRITWSLELDRREIPGGPPQYGVLLKFGSGLANRNPLGAPLHRSNTAVPPL